MSRGKRVRVSYVVGDNAGAATKWTIWPHGNSFYVSNSAMTNMKISLHGWDYGRGVADFFRLSPRKGETPQALSGVQLVAPRTGWPCVFPGELRDGATLAVRVRSLRESALHGGVARAQPKPSSANAILPVPEEGWAADLDLLFAQYPARLRHVDPFPGSMVFEHLGVEVHLAVSTGWPGEESGFLMRNERGVVVRGRTRTRRLDLHPSPTWAREERTETPGRYLHFDIDDGGVLWAIEGWNGEAGAP